MTETICECGRPTSGAWLCGQCSKTLAYSLANVAAYYDDLGTVAAKQARYGQAGATKGSIGKEQPLPVDLRFVSGPPEAAHRGATIAPGTQLRWDTWNTVVAWCRTVMDEQPQASGPVCASRVVSTEGGRNAKVLDCMHVSCHVTKRRRWPTNTIRSMCLYLDRQHRWIEGRDWAPVMLGEFLDIEKRLARMVNRPADRWYAGKCSATDLLGATCTAELYASVDRGMVECPACETTHDVAARRDFLLAEAKDYLVTATEAAGALLAWTDYDGSETKLMDRIRKWRDRDKLEVVDVTSLLGKDRHLYRLGDIQALMIEGAQHEQRRRVDNGVG